MFSVPVGFNVFEGVQRVTLRGLYMYRIGVFLAASILAIGCVRVDYLDYRGSQEWPTGSAFVRLIADIEVYEGLPQRPYEVIGIIDVFDDDPFDNDYARKKILQFVESEGADALIWLSDRIVASGALNMGDQIREPATVDTGRSTQPEVMVTRVNQYTAMTTTKLLRSSLLLIKWKHAEGPPQ